MTPDPYIHHLISGAAVALAICALGLVTEWAIRRFVRDRG